MKNIGGLVGPEVPEFCPSAELCGNLCLSLPYSWKLWMPCPRPALFQLFSCFPSQFRVITSVCIVAMQRLSPVSLLERPCLSHRTRCISTFIGAFASVAVRKRCKPRSLQSPQRSPFSRMSGPARCQPGESYSLGLLHRTPGPLEDHGPHQVLMMVPFTHTISRPGRYHEVSMMSSPSSLVLRTFPKPCPTTPSIPE